MWNSIAAVFGFEWRRALSLSRIGWWALLALFPVVIASLIRMTIHEVPPPELWTYFLFAMVPMLISMLGTFLWATPAISSELEGRSWIYLAVRPHGSVAVMLGKYLATIAWALSAAVVGLVLAMLVIPAPDLLETGGVILGITLLSCPAYAAVYLLLGTLFPKRSMVIAVAYTLIFEIVVSFVPAVMNTLTVQYRLRTLLVLWGDLPLNYEQGSTLAFVGDPPAWEHALLLLAYTAIVLAAAVGVIRFREFSTAEEGEA